MKKNLQLSELQSLMKVISQSISIKVSKKIVQAKALAAQIINEVNKHKLETSYIKTNELLKEESTISVYNCLKILVDDFILNIKSIHNLNECPPQFRKVCDSIVYTSQYYCELELTDLVKIETQLQNQFGSIFIQKAKNNADCLISQDIIKGLPFKNYPNSHVMLRHKALLSGNATSSSAKPVQSQSDKLLDHSKLNENKSNSGKLQAYINSISNEKVKSNLNTDKLQIKKSISSPIDYNELGLKDEMKFQYPSIQLHHTNSCSGYPICNPNLVEKSSSGSKSSVKTSFLSSAKQGELSSFDTSVESKHQYKGNKNQNQATIGNRDDYVIMDEMQVEDKCTETVISKAHVQNDRAGTSNYGECSNNSFSLFN